MNREEEEMGQCTSLDERMNIRGEIESLHATLQEREKRYNERFSAQETAVNAALAAAEKAVTKAEIAQEKRLDLLNEFRAQAADEGSKYATKESIDPLISRLGKTESSIAKLAGALFLATLLIPIVSTIVIIVTR